MAIKELHRVNADERMRIMLQDREKAERDRLNDLHHARKEGHAEGHTEGRAEARRQMVSALIDSGMTVDEVARRLHLSVEEIAALIKP